MTGGSARLTKRLAALHTYKALSEAVAPEHRVHYHGRMMSLLLADVCRRDSTGPEPMQVGPCWLHHILSLRW
jgi:hypothetical protein